MKYLALVLTVGFFFTRTQAEVYNYNYSKVKAAMQSVLQEKALDYNINENNVIVTKTKEIDLKTITNYIKEDMPNENPGWEKGRYSLTITLKRINKNKTEMKIEANLERYGVFSAMVLIPPAWTPAVSNGKPEAEIYEAVTQKLNSGMLPTKGASKE